MAESYDDAPTSSPEESVSMPKHLKICKGCMKTQPTTGAFCVYCGSRELTVIQSVEKESYLHQTVAGKFKIVDFIDKGGMGEVYLGKNEAIGQKVAIKFLHKKFAADENLVMRFLNEARSYCRVNHPNAVTLLEYGQHDNGALYIITEFIEGKSLSNTLKARGPFDLTKIISIGKQLCEVLTVAHDQGVIHRDLKPDNIMLTPGPGDRYQAKVLDFGIAKITDEDHGPMTETGAIFGTPEFMSPEQARGDSAGPRSDLYAIGLILFYMVTGKLPFKGKNKFAVLHKHINDEAPMPSEVAPSLDILPELEDIILCCLEKDPDDRFEDAEALYEALEDLRVHEGIRSTTFISMKSMGSGAHHKVPAHIKSKAKRDTSDHGEQVQDSDADEDDWDDVDEEASGAIGLADTLTTGDTPVPDAELIFEQAYVQTEPTMDEVEEDDFDLYVPPSNTRRVFVGIVAILIIAGGVAAAWKFSKIPDAKTPSPPVANVAEKPAEIQNILITSQVLALLSTTQDALNEGDLDAARHQLEASRLWLDDEQLPQNGMVLRLDLEKRLTSMTASDSSAQKLFDANQCRAVLTIANGMQSQSQGLAANWRERAMSCIKSRRKSRGGAGADKVEKVDKIEKGDKGDKIDLPGKGDITNMLDPKKALVDPPKVDPKDDKTKTDTKVVPKTVLKSGEKTDTKADPQGKETVDTKTDKKEEKTVPDGMALPPKKIE